MTRGVPIDDGRITDGGSSPGTDTSFTHRPWLLALVLVIITFVAYQPVWHAGFIWDDDDHLTANPAMTATPRAGDDLVVAGRVPLLPTDPDDLLDPTAGSGI